MKNSLRICNATELWHRFDAVLREISIPSIPTFSQNLDHCLGNDVEGLQLGSVTEILGLPGTGKTQLCLQLCASIQIPKVLGGLNAEALYVDTNTNFTITRFKEILFASLLKCQQLLEMPMQINEEEALKKLRYVKAIDLEKFCAFMHTMQKFIIEHSNVKLIVIDSIVFPFKEGINMRKRTGILFRQMADLQRLAIEHQIAVVLTNEMSTRVGLSSGSVVGALGDAWSHRCNKRLLLSTPQQFDSKTAQDRYAVLLKSNDSPNGVSKFRVTPEGIRDVE